MHRVLEGIVRNKRLASAYLFLGPPGSGKREAASDLADALGCKKIDRIEIKPEGTATKIEQVRELQRLVRYGPSSGGYLLAVIERADVLTPEAAAAFLKTLEEPPAGVIFILLVEREDRLPATIVSRCQRIIFEEKIKAWQPKPEYSFFYREIRDAKSKSALGLLELSAKMEKEKERIEELLYELVYFAKYELKSARLGRVLLETIKNLKKKANLKLALDVACLKLKEA